jgi:two-component system, OmpR family, phosphate regulon response regulator PhoB
MNILIIEDEEILARILTHKLAEKGYRLLVARDGKCAADLVLENQVDLVICDLMMPIVSGVTFLSMRENFMSLNVPVIVMSALEEADEILKKLDINFEYFIRKPINFAKLLEMIQQLELKLESN